MCGRFVRSKPSRALAELFRAEAMADVPPSYNIAPTQMIAAVRVEPEHQKRELAALNMGARALLVGRPEDRLQTDERARRDRGNEALFPVGLAAPPVPDPGRLLL
jgi:putative SOS response-associated peptidase YedK